VPAMDGMRQQLVPETIHFITPTQGEQSRPVGDPQHSHSVPLFSHYTRDEGQKGEFVHRSVTTPRNVHNTPLATTLNPGGDRRLGRNQKVDRGEGSAKPHQVLSMVSWKVTKVIYGPFTQSNNNASRRLRINKSPWDIKMEEKPSTTRTSHSRPPPTRPRSAP